MKTYNAYHFTSSTLRCGLPLPAIGETLLHKGPVVPCKSGLHASRHPFDALKYAPGNLLHRVYLEGDVEEHDSDKIVGRSRTIVQTVNATPLLWDFARLCALDVIELWDAPDVVVRYLETGQENLRHAALTAAQSASYYYACQASPQDAARAAARAASRYVPLAAARAASQYAAQASFENTALATQRDLFAILVDEAFDSSVEEKR